MAQAGNEWEVGLGGRQQEERRGRGGRKEGSGIEQVPQQNACSQNAPRPWEGILDWPTM